MVSGAATTTRGEARESWNSQALNPKPSHTLCPILRSLDLALSAAVSAVGGGDPCPANATICQLQRRLASSQCILRLALGLSAK